MIYFLTPTPLAIEAATTMGVSVKDGDGAIGKFGTGLKYAIAGVLRMSGAFDVWVEGEHFEFTAVASEIRGRSFQIVHCNGQPCGYTTELGKHWEPWQVFRELASNALDESGCWTRDHCEAGEAATVMRVNCREVEESEHSDSVFLDRSAAMLVESSMGAQVFAGQSRYFYFRGIRAGSFGGVAPVTVNVTDGSLSEDRMLDTGTARSELAWAFRSATQFDESLLLEVCAQHQSGSFWVDNLPSYSIESAALPVAMAEFLLERPKWVKHPAFRAALKNHHSRGNGLKAIEPDDRFWALIAEGEHLAKSAGVDPIPRDDVYLTRDLSDDCVAVTMMDTRKVWFSTKIMMLGRDEFMAGYIEEAMHAMTGFQDCTRELQNALLAIVVRMAGTGEVLEAAA